MTMKKCFLTGILVFGVLLNGMAQKTSFGSETGEFGQLLSDLERMLLKSSHIRIDTLGGKPRTIFVHWIRDHVHVTKAMKYIHPDLSSFIEFYLENQTREGIFFDYYFYFSEGLVERMTLFDQRYWKIFPRDRVHMHRLPVEADLEYLLVEGVYAVWQSTGDREFIRKWIPSLVKGMQYSMQDPLRWSKKHQLVKRGYTLDTWDFMQLPVSREEYSHMGKDIQKGIFDIDENTPMGIMHGDNSGMYAASVQLSEMYKALGNETESEAWKHQAEIFRIRTNALCWNGKYYAHFIEDDPQPPYLKMDQQNTLSLSNPYDINRGLPTEAMAQSIIKTYFDLKVTGKTNSFAEWYGIHPAVEPHFADYKPGSYMNGGVNTIVGGELAKAALQHGYESYGVDILKRMMELIRKNNNNLPVAYTPQGKVDEGIPDNWGQAAVYSALIEGLAGVVDKGVQFDDVEISPRWLAAGKDKASVDVVYGPTKKFLHYEYIHDSGNQSVDLNIRGVYQTTVRILLPAKTQVVGVSVNGRSYNTFHHEKINESNYIKLSGLMGSTVHIRVKYKQ
jgi:hypothetical protein